MERNFGLDLIRAIGIIMVLVSHGRHFLLPHININFLHINGFLGVELFFVLSGFLIGRIIIMELITRRNIKDLKRFYLRRWLRTLPAYYIVLGILVFIYKKEFNYQSLIFLQNSDPKLLDFFPVSWSLSVEEWFYLLIPLIFFLFVKNKKNFFNYTNILILFFLILRIMVTIKYNPSWNYGIRAAVYVRMDSLLIGVLLSGVKYYYNDYYNKLFGKNKFKILMLILMGITFISYYYFNVDLEKDFFAKTFLFTLTSLVCVLMVCISDVHEFKILQNTKRLFTFISLTSYSVYLYHYEIMRFIIERYNTDVSVLKSFMLLLISIILIYIISTIMYNLIEVNFIKLRDKITNN